MYMLWQAWTACRNVAFMIDVMLCNIFLCTSIVSTLFAVNFWLHALLSAQVDLTAQAFSLNSLAILLL